MRTRMIFSSQNNHQVDRRGAVVLSKVPLPLLRPAAVWNVPVTDAENASAASGFGARHWDILKTEGSASVYLIKYVVKKLVRNFCILYGLEYFFLKFGFLNRCKLCG